MQPTAHIGWRSRPSPPATAANVATAAKVTAIPTSIGKPLCTKGRDAPAKTKGKTGRMHGLMIVSMPAR